MGKKIHQSLALSGNIVQINFQGMDEDIAKTRSFMSKGISQVKGLLKNPKKIFSVNCKQNG